MDLVGQERCEHIFQVVLLVSLVRLAVPGVPEELGAPLLLMTHLYFFSAVIFLQRYFAVVLLPS